MTLFQIGVDNKSGAVTIWIEDACGLKPILVCEDLEGVKEFAGMLLEFYHRKKTENERIERVANSILSQAFDDGKRCNEEIQ